MTTSQIILISVLVINQALTIREMTRLKKEIRLLNDQAKENNKLLSFIYNILQHFKSMQ